MNDGMKPISELVSPETKYHTFSEPFDTELGATLPEVTVAYRTWGTLSESGDNAVLVCHALTGSADADQWWGGLFGPGRAFDPDRDFIVCSNVLGSCYGTTGPLSKNPATGRHYGPDFPSVTIRDMVRLQRRLLSRLGVDRLQVVVGASLGGMQVLEWGALYPEVAGALMPMGISGRHSAWCIAQSEAQRQAITADALWKEGWYEADAPPAAGLSAARMMAMCTYRSYRNFEEKFGRRCQPDGTFQAVSYMRHQGEKLVGRFDANTYITLTRAMDMHDLGRGRGGYEEAVCSITLPVEILSINSDVLYPKEEQQELATMLPNSKIVYLDEPYGHDAFLIDVEKVSRMVCDFRSALSERG